MKKILLMWVAAMLMAFAGIAAAVVDLNVATATELEAVKGIGPAKAKAIVEYREKNGPFKTVDDLKGVSGFGQKTIDKVRAEFSIGAAPAPAAVPAPAPKPVHH